MTLLDLFKKYSADELLATIDEMFPDTEKFHNTFREAYNLMMTLTPIASKKKITYKILSDEENDIEFFGAEDSCFNHMGGVPRQGTGGRKGCGAERHRDSGKQPRQHVPYRTMPTRLPATEA